MDKFEQRMQQASEELRDSTKSLTPPRTNPRSARHQPRWLAFAVGFAVVALAIGVLPGLIGNQNPPIGGPAPTNPTETTIPPSTTTGLSPSPRCSSSEVPVPETWPGNSDAPIEVTGRWHAIVRSAAACDFDQLERVAGPDFSIFFGAHGVEKFREWETEGEGQLGNLLLLLAMTPAVIEYPDAPTEVAAHYVWPAAFAYDHWDEVPQGLRDELLAIYTEQELEELFGGFGSYAGWRTSITEDGEWRFYTAGD